MELDAKIYIAGHAGLVGSALVRQLNMAGYCNLIVRDKKSLDLCDQSAVADFFQTNKPDYVFLAAGKTGGVYANDMYRADFIYENLMIQKNVIHQAFLNETKKLVFFACSSMYPQHGPQPVQERDLLSGYLEPTNEPFAIAKIAGLKLCESYNQQYGSDFISIISTNVYGPNQNYEGMDSLVVPALIQRFHEAKINTDSEVVIWGSGRPSRDFIFSDDLAKAAIMVVEKYSGYDALNIGTGQDKTISEMAEIIKQVVGCEAAIKYDGSKPDGVLVKLQDISKITDLGWQAETSFEQGIEIVYRDYVQQYGRHSARH